MALIFAFSFVQDLRMLPAMVLVTALVYGISRLPVSFMLSRLRYPSFFLLAVVVLLPFLSGQTVVASIGPLDLRQEGLVAVLLIATRFLCILTVGLVMFGTASFLTTLKAMRSLGLPAILTDMA
ncbi:MAG: CbiQ family ECF transporter T component, partial [Dehalococcoidia bacterium]